MIKSFFNSLFGLNAAWIYALYCMVFWLILFYNSEFILTQKLYDEYKQNKIEESYSDEYAQIASGLKEDDYDFVEDGETVYIDYILDLLFIVFQSIFQFIFISTLVYLFISFLKEVDYLSFSQVFKSVVIAEFVFLIPRTIKLVWFSLSKNYDFNDITNFPSFSLFNLLDHLDLPEWSLPFLEIMNIYELAYIFFLIWLIGYTTQINVTNLRTPVGVAYLIFLLACVGFELYLNSILN